jgi:hypothetical protein
VQFLVKWKGYTKEHNSWEPQKNLSNAQEKIKDFYKRNGGAIRKIRKEDFDNIPWRKIENYTSGNIDQKKVLFNWIDVHSENEP